MFNMNPWYYPYYSYAYPYAYQAVVSAPIPTAYVQRSSDDAPDQQFWYYCTKPQGYFPYVRECQGKWQKVIPFPVETTP
jgi:hypothetical protein